MQEGHIESLRRRLDEAEDSLRLIRERMSQYVLKIDIPLQLIREKERLEQEIVALQAQLESLRPPPHPPTERSTETGWIAYGSELGKMPFTAGPPSEQASGILQGAQPEQGPIRVRIDVVIKVVTLIVAVALILVVYWQLVLKPSGFNYLVRVEARATNDCIKGAKVIIEVPQEPPLDETTDVNGIAVIAIDSSYANQGGRLIVEAPGYQRYEQNIKLVVAALPDVVQLERGTLASTSTPTQTQTALPTAAAEVISDSLNLRAGCGTGYQALASYPQKTALDVLGKVAGAGWLKVKTPDGRTGWMQARYLQVNVPLVDVPIAACSFQDFERENGTPLGGGSCFWDAWFTTCSFESIIVHEGSRSVRVDAHALAMGGPGVTGGTMGINPSSSDPVDLSYAATICVWVHDTVGSNTVELKLRDIHDSVSNPVWSEMQSVMGAWTKIEWPLSHFAGVDMRNVKNLEIYEWNDGIYYFDDVGWQ